MSKQSGFYTALLLLLIATASRLVGLATTPSGLTTLEAHDVQITEQIRLGQVEVLYPVGDEGREALYHILLSASTVFTGTTAFGYRIASIWIATLSMAVLYTLTRRLFGRTTGVLTLAAASVPMWSILLGRAIARETMLPLLVSATLLGLARALPVYRRPRMNPNTAPFALLGVLLGIGLYIHPAHYMIVAISIAFVGYMVLTRQRMSRRTMGYLGFTFVIMVIVAIPYTITTLQTPQLGGFTRFLDEYEAIADVGLLETLGHSLMGLFIRGDGHIAQNVPGRPYLDPISGVIMLVGLISASQRFMQPRYGLIIVGTALLMPLALIAPESPNFMSYAAVMPLLAILFALGIKQLVRMMRKYETLIYSLAVLLLVANFGWSLWSIWSVWQPTPELAQAYHGHTAEIATYLNQTARDTHTVVCTQYLPMNNAQVEDVGYTVTLLSMMMDNAVESQLRYVDCRTGFVFTNGGEHQQVILLDETELHPYVQTWLEQGDLITEGVPENSVISLIVSDALSDTVGRFLTTAPTGYAPESPGGVAPAPLPVTFERGLTFLGYEKSNETTYLAGDTVSLITYWRADDLLPRNLKLFTHVLFDAETLVAQADRLDIVPKRLEMRDVFVQITDIALPTDLPPETYETSIGAYVVEQEQNVRLTILDNGQERGTRLFLGEILVNPSPES